MRFQVTICTMLCALLWAESPLGAQSAAPPTAIGHLETFQEALRETRGHSDWPGYLTAARQIKDLLNASPQSRLEFARAQIHVGQTAAALDELAAYARMGQSSPVIEKLPDFESLRQRKEFGAVRTRMAANRAAVARSEVAVRISDADLLAEDIDFDSASKRFLVSSVLQHRIVSIASDGALAEFGRAPDDWPVFALKVDARRGVVWATEVAVETFESVPQADRGRSAVLCYDLKTGQLLRRIEAPRPSALGDMALMADGSVVVSDGQHGGVYRLRPDEDRLERMDRGDFISPQTVVPASDSTRVYVPDYVRGLGLFDLGTNQVRWLPTSGRFALDGIDGLYRVGEQLIAVQNGTSPQRVLMFSMNSAGTKIVAERVIERTTVTLGVPTHGVIVRDAFYYIANSGWDALNDNGSVKSGARMTPPLVMKWRFPR